MPTPPYPGTRAPTVRAWPVPNSMPRPTRSPPGRRGRRRSLRTRCSGRTSTTADTRASMCDSTRGASASATMPAWGAGLAYGVAWVFSPAAPIVPPRLGQLHRRPVSGDPRVYGRHIDPACYRLLHQPMVAICLPAHVEPVGSTCRESAGRSGFIVAVRVHAQTGLRLTPDRPPIILT